MAPIRIGLIGLTATPGAWANSAHLPYLSQSSKYKIVALANSSVASAEAAMKEHKLPSNVKAYGSPTDIAADPDVDMVVVSVNVAKHYELIKPALEAGKMAYVEWPLGNDTAEAEELTELAKKKNVKTLVGLQGRQSNIIRTLKGIVEGGKLGKVLSSTVVAESGVFDTEVPVKYKYFTDSRVGGNNFTIVFGHCKDSNQPFQLQTTDKCLQSSIVSLMYWEKWQLRKQY
jgi:predicted dehydrogenase